MGGEEGRRRLRRLLGCLAALAGLLLIDAGRRTAEEAEGEEAWHSPAPAAAHRRSLSPLRMGLNCGTIFGLTLISRHP